MAHPIPRGTLALLLAAALLPACGEGLTSEGDVDPAALDLEGANDPDLDGTRMPFAACPNGGNVEPSTPSFSSGVESYASYDGQDTCAPTARPGVEAFRDLVLKTYPCTTSGGITRACSIGGTSEHKEGRAWDWMVKVGHPAPDALLGWLLATDSKGNKHALARRLGIMYMVWNHKIWKSYQASKGWQAYSGSNPHTDHVHFSFSWNGANKKTSFWSGGPASPAPAPAPTPTPTPPAPTPATPPADQAPKGYLDAASCTSGFAGWAQDPDKPQAALQVELYIDGGPGSIDPFLVKADQSRSDLCQALGSCEHGFAFAIPSSFVDGADHVVRAFAIGDNGKRVELAKSGLTFRCGAPTPASPAPSEPPASTSPATPADPGSADPGSDPGTSPGPGQSWGQGSNEPPVAPEAEGGSQLAGGCSLGGAPAAEGLPLLALLALLALGRRRR